ncbi:MAG: DNA polymerase I, partial [Lachnospiraceae bacterium]|nr:DNA polymerase I [Lachnospiraceae bacterium]
EDVTELDRRRAKAVNFGIVYGISSFGLGENLNISRAEAQKYIDDYYLAYPALKSYLDSLVSSAKKDGYALTMFKRRRPIPELFEKNFMTRSFGERVAMNSPVQGTAADIMKIAMVKVFALMRERGLSSRMLLQVHDEILIETAPGEEEEVRTILSEGMEKAAALSVPLKIDIETGKNWFDAK